MGILIGLVGIIVLVLVLSVMATGLGTLLGVFSLFTHPVNGRKPRTDKNAPARSRTFDEIQAAKGGGMYVPDPRFK